MKLNEIQQNYPQLGRGFENLGSPSGLYLRSDGNKNWSVVRLNCIEKFLRWLGFYSSTHLETIARNIDAEFDAPGNLIYKISRIWERLYPKKETPFQELINSDLLRWRPENPPPPELQARGERRFLDRPDLDLVPPLPRQHRPEPLQAAPVQEDFLGRRPPMDQLDYSLKDYSMAETSSGYLLGNVATETLKIGSAVITLEGGDLLRSKAPCIVNAANEQCLGGGGIDFVIHKAAGPGLLDLCKKLPIVPGTHSTRCKTGDAVITGSADLAAHQIQYIIHAVGPRGNHPNRDRLLESVYQSILTRAQESGERSVAIPSISTGIFAFPFGKATEIAIRTIEKYLHDHPGNFDSVRLIFLDHDPDFYNQNIMPTGAKLEAALESVQNFAWAVHIARHMEHPHAKLDQAINQDDSGWNLDGSDLDFDSIGGK